MQQVLFRIPIRISGWLPDGIPIYGFAVMLIVAFFLCTTLAARRAAREGINSELFYDLALWLFVGGILGARFAFLIAEGEPLWEVYKLWNGGLVLYGSVIGALAAYVLAYFLLIRKHRVSTLCLTDVIAPSIAVGICLGRIGCFLNGCCFGNVACPDCLQVHFPFSSAPRYVLTHGGYQTAAGFTLNESALDTRTVGAVDPASPAAASGLKPGDVIVKASAVPSTSAGDERAIEFFGDLHDFLERQWPRGKNELTLHVKRGNAQVSVGPFAPKTLGLHPTQLYESISMALVFLLLTAYYPFRRHAGEVMAVLMLCYGLQRTFNEMLRNDPRPVGFEKYFSLSLVAAGLVAWIWFRFLTSPMSRPISQAAQPIAAGSPSSD
jgi:phosphatidylglycerol:prolipoprotein diacylglycerol transferase